MSFIRNYWSQIVILVSLLTVILIVLRRMPRKEEHVEMAKEIAASKPKRTINYSEYMVRVREWFVIAWEKLKSLAEKGRDLVLRKKKKEEVQAVETMFDGGEEVKHEQPIAKKITWHLRKKNLSDEIDKKRKTDELLRRAKMYLRELRNKHAEDTFIEAVKLSPRDERIYFELGEMYLKAENYDDAQASFAEVIKLKSHHILAHSRLGLIAYRKKKYDDAAMHYEQASKLEPKNVKHLGNLALVLKASGKTRRALKFYERAFFDFPSEIDFGIHAANLALDLKRIRETEKILKELEKRDPKSVKLAELKERLAALKK